MSIDSPIPETRLSLLARLVSHSDREAWVEFVQLYTPVIFRTACYLGLQPSDADDVVQQVLLSVSRALQQRPHDPEQAKFRTWLSRVTRNATLNALTRAKPDRATGDSAMHEYLHELPAEQETETVLRRELQREMFQRAAAAIQHEFTGDSWRAFWLTTVDGRDMGEVAAELGKQIGSVYAARSRIMRRLREEVEKLMADQD